MKRHVGSLLAAAALIALPTQADAQLVLQGQSTATGGGLGSVATVLTLQSPANGTAESGCIAPSGTASCGFTNLGVQSGASQTLVRPVSQFPGLTGSSFRLFFNGSEPGNDASLTVNNLVVRLYSSTGTQVFTSQNLPAPINLSDVLNGTGNFGYLFGLSAPDAALFQTALTANAGAVIGVGASITNASGGLETISIGVGPGSTSTSVVPEPSTYLLMASGLAGVFLVRRRRRA